MAMDGKVCVITGSNNGFAFVAAKRLSALGATVAMVCRSAERGEAARAAIATETGARPELLVADLELQSEVRRVAGELAGRFARIDVLMNNAGFPFPRRELTAEGFERTFALNYLAYFTLCRELRPQLRAAGAARIVNTASSAHRRAELRLDNLQGERDFGARRFPPLPKMYSWTNSCRIMLTYELAERYAPDGITANCFCPGLVMVERAGATRAQNLMVRFLPRFLLPKTRTPEEAAETMVFLASSEKAAQLTGEYYESGVRVRSSEQTYDRELRRQLWDATEALLAAK